MIIKFDYVNSNFENTIIGVGENENKFKHNSGFKVYNLSDNMVKRYQHQNYRTYVYNINFSLHNEDTSEAYIINNHKQHVLKYILRERKLNRILSED